MKVPHTCVIPTHTAQEHDGPRNFMDITVTALKFLTTFGKIYTPRAGTICIGTTSVQVVGLGYKVDTNNWILSISSPMLILPEKTFKCNKIWAFKAGGKKKNKPWRKKLNYAILLDEEQKEKKKIFSLLLDILLNTCPQWLGTVSDLASL